MNESLKKYRDRLRIMIILYTFCDPIKDDSSEYFGVFRTEIKIQALDFLLRYPDFLSIELMDLMSSNSTLDQDEIKNIIANIYKNKEPDLRVDEMEKFFHGAYESIDDVIAFLVSVGFIKHESKRRTDGTKYDKQYYITKECVNKIDSNLKNVAALVWYFNRCETIKKFFNHFSGSELKARQYKYSEYSNISYGSHIENINDKVKAVFLEKFNSQLV